MIRNLFIPIVFFLFFVECKKENAVDCFRSNGTETSEIRKTSLFTRVEVSENIEVNIFNGAEHKVEVVCGKNIVKNILTHVENDTLKIENANRCNFVRGYKRKIKVNVTLPYLHSVLHNGVASLIINQGFTQDTVKVRAESSGDIYLNGNYGFIRAHSNGNGDITINGTAKILSVFINGTNFFNAENLRVSDKIRIETLTIGDSYLNADGLKNLEYVIYNKGNIYYKGNPTNIKGVLEEKALGRIKPY